MDPEVTYPLSCCLASPADEDGWSAGEAGLDAWIAENLNSRDVRRSRVAALVTSAQPFQYLKSQVLLAIGNMFSANVK